MAFQEPPDPVTSNVNPSDTTIKPGPGPGERPVNLIGIILISAYLVALTLFSVYVLVKVWPRCLASNRNVSQATSPPGTQPSGTQPSGTQPGGTQPGGAQPGGAQPGGAQPGGAQPGAQPGGTQPSGTQPGGPQPSGTQPGGTQPGGTQPSGTQAGSTTEPQCKNPESIGFFWGTYLLWDEVRVLLIVMVAGVLGSLLHLIRSLFWYVGNRDLRWSWLLMYVLLPFSGALLAVAFYLVIRGGFFPQASADQGSPISFAALAMLTGLFSAQAGLKLQQVFETIFSPAPPGANPQPQQPKTPPSAPANSPTISGVSPDHGPGGQPVTINGANFSDGATVQFGDAPADSTKVVVVNNSTITAVTPPHDAGPVDVVVTNKDKQSGTLHQGYTYQG